MYTYIYRHIHTIYVCISTYLYMHMCICIHISYTDVCDIHTHTCQSATAASRIVASALRSGHSWEDPCRTYPRDSKYPTMEVLGPQYYLETVIPCY